MKPKLFVFLTAIALSATPVVRGASLTWNSASAGGPWDTTTTNWLDGAAPAAWNNATPDSAVFDSTGAGTVTLGAAITANSVSVNAAGYTITGNTLTFGGSSPAITTGAAVTISSGVAGTAGYTKNGSGTVTFSGTKTITGPVVIAAGAANLSTGSAGSSLTVAAGASATTTASNAAGWNTSCRTWNINGAFTIATGDSAWTTAANLNNATMGSVTGSNWSFGGGSAITNTGTSTFTAGGNFVLREGNPGNTLPVTNSGTLIFNCPLTSANHIAFSGAGTVRLNAVNTATGNITVNSGTLMLGASATLASNNVTLAPGALLDSSAIPAGFTVPAAKNLYSGRAGTPATDINGSLTVAGNLNPGGTAGLGSTSISGGLTLNGASINLDRSGITSDVVHLTGPLTLTGTNTFRANAGYFPAGTYTLADGFSSSTGTTANLAWGNPTRGQTPTFTLGAGTLQLTLDAGAPGSLTWSGTTSTVWDVNATSNWNTGSEKFYQLDNVTFADSPVNATVTLAGALFPSSVAFTNASTAYVMRGGTGSINGTAALSKTGAGSVTLWNNANSFSGGTTIDAGTLFLNNGAALASGAYTPLGTGPIALNGGTLQLNPGNNTGGTYTFPNAITLNGGTLFQDDGVNHFTAPVTVASATTLKTQYNLKDLYLDGGISGSVPITITDQGGNYGCGAVHVAADGTYGGTVTVNASAGGNGSLVLRADNAMPTASVVLETTSGDDGYGPTPVGLTLAGAASNVTLAGLSGVSSNSRVWNGDATGRTLTINAATNLSYNGRIGGGTVNGNKLGLVKNGAGTLSLNGANTYSGSTVINAGTLAIPSSQSGTGDITVNDGTTLDLSVVPGSSLSPANLTLGSSTGATLSIRNFASSPTTAPINAGAITTHGAPESIVINLSGTFTGGVFPLLRYTPGTSVGGSGFSAFKLGPLPRGISATLEDHPGSGEIDILIGTVNPLIWTGTNGSAWDVDTSVNWFLVDSLSTYHDEDIVVFDDNGGTNNAISLNGPVLPAAVTVNATIDYSISGSGAIAGTTGLTKTNSGTLTLATANSFTGPVVIDSGILVMGNAAALGSAATGTLISGYGTLDLNGYSITEALSLGGTGPLGAGALINNSATAVTVSGAVNVTADTGFGGTGALDLTGVITGGSVFQKMGTGTATITSGGNPYIYTGSLVVGGGNLVLSRSGGYGRLFNCDVTIKNGARLTYATDNGFQHYPGNITVEAGGTLDLANGITSNIGTNSGSLLMQGGATLSGTGSSQWGSWTISTPSSKITVAGGDVVPAVINAQNVTGGGGALTLDVADVTGNASADILLTGIIGAPASNTGFGVTTMGNGTVSLSAANVYVGNTTINSGSSLVLTQSGALAFKVAANGVTTSMGGAGSVLLDGSFNLDLSTADKTGGNTWTLVNTSTLAVTYGEHFTLPGFTKNGDVWSMADGSGTWTFTQSTGVLALTASPFATWIGGFGLTNASDRLPGADPDHDGISNGIEFVIGGNPATGMDSALMPTGEIVRADVGAGMVDYFKFTFRRSAASAALHPGISYNTDLGATWTSAEGTPGVVIVPTPDGFQTGVDKVETYIPQALSVGGKLFGRLKVTIP
ncbi:autotransporter-associated beta strand repeat-containing protein [Luteolibacter ambystomatis]|uniref:Autotransporter-associated beta strand repeat-containing protein n=1 Tax=Luteolibacter ambystomatis TaxID=2824561 RepID=A0A975G5M7_9BACT|nr:autotransporter-associated beta strand repeat-containing protein [Luteolibacter ambystomatis]QUE49782.1 autotransporter-associated beta strand repeat-containing protein [Luteolibacter ambystomatis]